MCLGNQFRDKVPIDPKSCNMSCSKSNTAVLNDCGGVGAYSVYRTGEQQSNKHVTSNSNNLSKYCMYYAIIVNRFCSVLPKSLVSRWPR